ncbi:MAG: rhodanese-like domain-containing protein [Clostridia bacterium]
MKIYEKLKQLWKSNKREIRSSDLDYEEVKIKIKEEPSTILIDVRSPQEYKEGHLEGSLNIPLYNIETQEESVLPDKTQSIIVYCQSGNRSKKAMEILKKDGYQRVCHMKGGLDEI